MQIVLLLIKTHAVADQRGAGTLYTQLLQLSIIIMGSRGRDKSATRPSSQLVYFITQTNNWKTLQRKAYDGMHKAKLFLK